MTISLQLTCKTPPPDGVLVKSQPRDLESVQSSSFHEVFKDEEKKLQKENETSTFSVAAVLAAIQTAPVVESVPVLDASHLGSDIGKSDTQPALQAVPVAAQVTDVSPGVIQNGQEKTIAENKAAGKKVDTPLPVSEFPQTAVKMTGNEDTQAAIKIQPESERGVEKSALPTTDRANAARENPAAGTRAVEAQSRGVVFVPDTSVAAMALPEIQYGNQGVPIAFGANLTSEKSKSVEVQSRVVPSAPDISNMAEVMPELKNIKNDQPSSVRLKVVSEKPVVEAKTVEVRSRVAVSAPVLSGHAMDVTNIQSEYHDTTTVEAGAAETSETPVVEAKTVGVQSRVAVPGLVNSDPAMDVTKIQSEYHNTTTVVGAEETSKMPGVAAKAVEMQSRVSASIPVNLKREVVEVVIQNEQPAALPVVDAKEPSEKPALEAKTFDVRAHGSPAPAPAMAETTVAVPDVQNTKPDVPTALYERKTNEPSVVTGKSVEMQSRAAVPGPEISADTGLFASDIQNKKPAIIPAVNTKETSETPVVAGKMVETQPRVTAPAPEISADTAVPAPHIQNIKSAVMPAVNTKESKEPPVVAAKTIEMQSSIAAPAPENPDMAVLGAKVTAEKPVVEIRAVEAQSTVAVSVAEAEDTAMVMPESQNKKPDVPVVGSKAATEKSVMEAKAVETQAPVAAGISDNKKVVGARRDNETKVVEAAYRETGQEFNQMAVTTDPVHGNGVVNIAEKTTAPQVNVKATEVIQQIMHQMKARIKSGATSMRLQLNPVELGGIEVQMTRNAEGVSVTFFAEQASTGHLLETQMNQLRQSLKDAGVQLTGLNISQHDQPKQEGGFFKGHSYSNQYFQSSAPQTETANKERERQDRIGGSLNEVDYLI